MKCPRDTHSMRTMMWFSITADSQRHDIRMYLQYKLPAYKEAVRTRFRIRLDVLRHGLVRSA